MTAGAVDAPAVGTGAADELLSVDHAAGPQARSAARGPTPTGEPVWFGEHGVPLLGWVHRPSRPTGGAVVLCPPLFLEHVLAHFVYRRLACQLAQEGMVAVRFDYPGTGDSARTPGGPGWVGSCIDAADRAVELARSSATGPLAVLGMRMGALVAAACAERRRDVDALVLWDPCTSGRSFLRRQRSLFALRFGTAADGAVEVPGVALDEAAAADLSALRHPSSPGPSRVLVLARPGDGPAVTAATGAGPSEGAGPVVESVTLPEGEQEALLEVDPLFRQAPTMGPAACVGWLRSLVADDSGRHPAEATADPRDEATVDPRDEATGDPRDEAADRRRRSAAIATGDTFVRVPVAGAGDQPARAFVRERARWLGPAGLFAVESAPADPSAARTRPVVVLVPQGNDRHTGAGRLWVTLARRWAADGFRCLRVDLSGLGESPARPGQPEQVPWSSVAFDDMADIVGEVADDPRDVVLVGLCSSGYQTLEAATELDVMGVLAVNPVLRFVPPECWEGGPMAPRRKLCVLRPHWMTVVRSHLPERVGVAAGKVRARLEGRRRVESRLGWQHDVVRRGIDVTCVCGEVEAGPLLGSAGSALTTRGTGGSFHVEVVEGLDHSLMTARDRQVVSERLTARLRRLAEG